MKRKFPTSYPDQVLPEAAVPGITEVLYTFHERIADLQRRFLRVIAEGIGCHETFFDDMVADGPTLTRAIRYPSMRDVPGDGHVWAGAHGDINLITALPRATAPGLQVKVDDQWVDAVAPDGKVIINTGIMLERLTNGIIPIGWHGSSRHRFRGGAVQRRAVLPPAPVDGAPTGAVVHHAGEPAALLGDHRRRRTRRGDLPRSTSWRTPAGSATDHSSAGRRRRRPPTANTSANPSATHRASTSGSRTAVVSMTNPSVHASR